MRSNGQAFNPVVTPFICAEVRDKLQTKFRLTEQQANELVSKVVSVSLLRDDVGEISSPLRDPDDSRMPQLHTTASSSSQATTTYWNSNLFQVWKSFQFALLLNDFD